MALIKAAGDGNMELVEKLLPKNETRDIIPAVEMALLNKKIETARYILKKYKLIKKFMYYLMDNPKTLQIAVDDLMKPYGRRTIFTLACDKGKANIVEILLECNYRTSQGRLSFVMAFFEGLCRRLAKRIVKCLVIT